MDNKVIKKRKINDEIAGTAFTIAPVLGIVIFTFIPLLMAFAMSFMDVKLGLQDAKIYPLKDIFSNYLTVIQDEYFWNALKNNLILFIELPISIIISIVVAELLSKKVKFTNTFKVILFIPYVCSVTATTFMWNWILDPNYGIVNQLLGTNIDWFSNEMFVWSIMIMGLWTSCGYRILLFTAAITNVNTSLKEAARMDGANPIQVFLHVTIPAITPTIFYVLVMGLIGVFQEFTRIQVLNGGTKCNTIVNYIYTHGWSGTSQMGVACAASVILALLIFGLTKLNFSLSKKWVNYDVD